MNGCLVFVKKTVLESQADILKIKKKTHLNVDGFSTGGFEVI